MSESACGSALWPLDTGSPKRTGGNAGWDGRFWKEAADEKVEIVS